MEALFEKISFFIGDKIDVIAQYFAVIIPVIIAVCKGGNILNNIVKSKQLKKYVGLIKEQEKKYDEKLEQQRLHYEKLLEEQRLYYEELIESNKQAKRKAKQKAYDKIVKGIEEIPQEEEKCDSEPEINPETVENVEEIEKPEEKVIENEEDIIKVDLL